MESNTTGRSDAARRLAQSGTLLLPVASLAPPPCPGPHNGDEQLVLVLNAQEAAAALGQATLCATCGPLDLDESQSALAFHLPSAQVPGVEGAAAEPHMSGMPGDIRHLLYLFLSTRDAVQLGATCRSLLAALGNVTVHVLGRWQGRLGYNHRLAASDIASNFHLLAQVKELATQPAVDAVYRELAALKTEGRSIAQQMEAEVMSRFKQGLHPELAARLKRIDEIVGEWGISGARTWTPARQAEVLGIMRQLRATEGEMEAMSAAMNGWQGREYVAEHLEVLRQLVFKAARAEMAAAKRSGA